MEYYRNTKRKSGGIKFMLPPNYCSNFSVMQKKPGTVSFVFVLSVVLLFWNDSSAQTIFKYPSTPIIPVVDTIFGKVITDNYRWLEDVNSTEVQAWLKQQADLTNNWLENIPGRNILFEEYKKLDELNTEIVKYVIRKGDRYFYPKVLKGENVGKLYYKTGEDSKEILLFDPVAYEKEQSLTAPITFRFVPSNDGRKVALFFTDNGKGDIYTVKFMHVDTKTFYSESLYPVSSPQIWTPDNEGFVYGEFQTTDQLSPQFFLDIPLKVHRLGEEMKDDKVIVSRTNNPELKINNFDFLWVSYSPDYSYLMLELWSGPQEQIRRFFATSSDFSKPQINWKPLTLPEDEVRSVLIARGNAYMVTKKGAPNRKLVVAPLNNLDSVHTKTLIAESEKLLEEISLCKDYLFIQKTDGINAMIEQYEFETGSVKSVNLPQRGSGYPETFDALTNDCILWVSSWNQPGTPYKYNAGTGQSVKSLLYPTKVKSHYGIMVSL